MGQKFLDESKSQRAVRSAQYARWMIMVMTIVNTGDGIETCQRVRLKLRLGASYVNEEDFMVYDVKGIDIVLGIR